MKGVNFRWRYTVSCPGMLTCSPTSKIRKFRSEKNKKLCTPHTTPGGLSLLPKKSQSGQKLRKKEGGNQENYPKQPSWHNLQMGKNWWVFKVHGSGARVHHVLAVMICIQHAFCMEVGPEHHVPAIGCVHDAWYGSGARAQVPAVVGCVQDAWKWGQSTKFQQW